MTMTLDILFYFSLRTLSCDWSNHIPVVGSQLKVSDGLSAIHWFRRGLRLHDNPALMAILNRPEPLTLRPVFIMDPFFTSSERIGVNRWKCLLQCLDDLDKSLRRLKMCEGPKYLTFPRSKIEYPRTTNRR